MKPVLCALGVIALSGCCIWKCPDCRDTGGTNQPTNGNTQPVLEPIDGSKNYPARQQTLGVFVITLPHSTDSSRIVAVSLWINTTGMEGTSRQKKVTCDTIQIVTEPPEYTIIASSDMFRSILSENKDAAYMTAGSALSQGDTFDFIESGSENFELLRRTVARGEVWVKLKNNHPQPKTPIVNSAKVNIISR